MSNCCCRDSPHLFNLINFYEFCGWLKSSECSVVPEIGVIWSGSVVTGEYLQCVTVNAVSIITASCQSWRPELIAWSSTQHWALLPHTHTHTYAHIHIFLVFSLVLLLISFSPSFFAISNWKLVTDNYFFLSIKWNVSIYKKKKSKTCIILLFYNFFSLSVLISLLVTPELFRKMGLFPFLPLKTVFIYIN